MGTRRRIVQGFWDCPTCNAKKVLGKHKYCPNCGAVRSDDVKIYPPSPKDPIIYVDDQAWANDGLIGIVAIVVLPMHILINSVVLVAIQKMLQVKIPSVLLCHLRFIGISQQLIL